MSEKMLVAAYGTLRVGHGNNRLFKSVGASHIGSGKTEGFHSMYASGIPFVHENGGTSQIAVDVFELDADRIGPVDGLEGHPDWYQRRETDIIMDDGSIKRCWLYFYDVKTPTNLTLIESGDYNDYRRQTINS